MKKIFPLLATLFLISLFFGCNSRGANGSQDRSTVKKDTVYVSVQDASRLDSFLLHKVTTLEQEGGVYKEFFEKLDGVTSVFSTFMEWVAVLVGIISVIIIGFQTLAFRRDERILKDMRESQQRSFDLYEESSRKLLRVIDEMRDNYRESIESQEQSNSRLMDAVIRNTGKTTDFIASYENLIAIKTTSEGLNKEIQQIKDEKEAIARAQKAKIVELNGKAMRLTESVFKSNFSSTFFGDYEDKAFNAFYIEIAPYISLTESNKELEKNWNADVYFIMGLNFFLNKQSKDADIYLKKSFERVEGFVKSQPENSDVLFPERKLYESYGGNDGWNKLLKSKCAFYAGLNHYRLGEFIPAIPKFEEAFKDFPDEIDPQFFYYQSQYWAKKLDNFAKSVEKMAALSNIIESDSQKDERTKKMALARLYKKIGDFYLPSLIDDRYAKEKNLQDALKHYKNAYEVFQGVNWELQNIPGSQLVPMVYFSLGKALKDASESWKESPDDLFKKSIFTCNQVIGNVKNPETKYILFYTLAYCQHQLGLVEGAKYSITFALIELEIFCSNLNYFGYSPVNNSMLPAQQLREELNAFKLEIFSRT
jgi:tetratricopeptide (TPR) repeat protein